jgi:hypothetical protein
MNFTRRDFLATAAMSSASVALGPMGNGQTVDPAQGPQHNHPSQTDASGSAQIARDDLPHDGNDRNRFRL